MDFELSVEFYMLLTFVFDGIILSIFVSYGIQAIQARLKEPRQRRNVYELLELLDSDEETGIHDLKDFLDEDD